MKLLPAFPSACLATGLLFLLSLTSCSSETPVSDGVPATSKMPVENAENPTEDAANTKTLAFETYAPDELAAANEGGCGMTLLEPGTDYWQDGAYFFHGFSGEGKSTPAYIKLDGELVPFVLTSASGESFYGQQTTQIFESENGEITLEANVTLGGLGEIESVEITEGTLTLRSQDQTETVAVVGDAGC